MTAVVWVAMVGGTGGSIGVQSEGRGLEERVEDEKGEIGVN